MTGNEVTRSLGAIVVTHEPELSRLAQVLGALTGQVEAVAVVDDGSCPATRQSLQALLEPLDTVAWLPQAEHRGQAAALNRGLGWARAQGLSFGLLLDQDSLPEPALAERLLAALIAQPRAAAAGAQCMDRREGRSLGFWRYSGRWAQQIHPAEQETAPLECDFLITSGCLLRLSALDTIGLMDERLFIDSVDREWCFRARARGFSLLGVPAAWLDHQLGGERVAGRIRHSPDRLYYMTRNRVTLYRHPDAPIAWVLNDVPRAAAKLVVASTLFGPRRQNLSAMLGGLVDALRGRLGKR